MSVYVVPVVFALVLASLTLFTSSTLSNLYVTDAFYFLNAGYMIYHGYVPHVDFEWQFGGYEAFLISLSFKIFGVSVKGLDQAVFLGYVVSLVLLCLGMIRQAGLTVFYLVLILVTAVSMTGSPLEHGEVEMGRQSFAMYYNRICWVLVIVLYSTLLTSERPLRQWQIFTCATAGLLVTMTKLPFVLLLIPAVIPILFRNGAAGVLLCAMHAIVLASLAWYAFGYGPNAYFLAITDLANVTSGLISKYMLLRKLVYLTLYNFIPILVVTLCILYVWLSNPRTSPWLYAKLMVLGAVAILSIIVTVGTGTLDYFFFAQTPILVLIPILCMDEISSSESSQPNLFAIVIVIYTLAFSTPHIMNYLAGLRSEAALSATSVFKTGPLAGLIVNRPDDETLPGLPDEPAIARYILQRNRIEGGTAWISDYLRQYIQADAIRLVADLPDVHQRRILTFYYYNILPFALNAPPIRTFPLSVNENSPSIQALQALPIEVDTVLVFRDDWTNPLHQRFSASIKRSFELRSRSAFWDLYVRRRPSAAIGSTGMALRVTDGPRL